VSSPADLSLEQPMKSNLRNHLKPAKALNLAIPPSLPGQADRIIE
jgi:hypothetical protein